MVAVSETKGLQIKGLQFRTKLPVYFRYAAIGVFAVALLAIGAGLYRSRDPDFRMKGFPTSLSEDVVAVVEGYERTEATDGVVKYYIKADKATTFSDNHQEFENVFLEVFAEDGSGSDLIKAAKAVHIPEENKNFTAYFAGAVDIQTRDGLKVNTEQVTYKKADETATVEEKVFFRRDNLHGSAVGALVRIADKRLELFRDVNITSFESPNSEVRRSVMAAGSAAYDHAGEIINLDGGITASMFAHPGNARNIDVSAGRANIHLDTANASHDVARIELFENVKVDAAEPGTKPTKISAAYALYDKATDEFDLKHGVEILTVQDEKPTVARAAEAVYEQRNGTIKLHGNAEITQSDSLIKGDNITAHLYPDRKLKNAVANGNSFLRQQRDDGTTEISAAELNASFGADQLITNANAVGSATAVLNPSNNAEYSRITLSAPRSISLIFAGAGLLSKVATDGRTTLQLDALSNNPDAANKRLTADSIKTSFYPDGKNMERAEAIGDAELTVDPLRAAPETYFTKITAPRFDCDFFVGNNAKSCVAATKARAERTSKVPDATRGVQTITAERLNANFNQTTKDVERLEANGGAKFTELDRNATANQIAFTTGDGRVILRGGEPTAWDSSARAKAAEIDWATREQKSFLRGAVSTTYYSQKQTGSAAPFGSADKPVFLTSATAEIDHQNQSALYSGNARGWQENNYVRADTISIFQREGKFFANGSVQSLLYNAKRKDNGRESIVPVYASSQKLAYDRTDRILRYQENVDIRQGADRITGGSANVFLSSNNEVARTDMERDVIITQPNRRAVADFASYTQADESVVLKGNPAKVDDAENGSSQGGQLTVYLRNNRVETLGRTKQNTVGRTRSVYKVKSN